MWANVSFSAGGNSIYRISVTKGQLVKAATIASAEIHSDELCGVFMKYKLIINVENALPNHFPFSIFHFPLKKASTPLD